MKVTRTKQVWVCDGCGTDCDYPTMCQGCGKAFCYDCREKRGTEYAFGAYTQGYADGFYCHPCEVKPEVTSDPLYQAYRKLLYAKTEYKKYRETWDKIADGLEKQITGEYDRRKQAGTWKSPHSR